MITDEQLSAFLDAELSEQEMEVIREALIEDESLTERLAEFANVDHVIKQTFSAIDERPVPEAIEQLLDDSPSNNDESVMKSSAQVIDLSAWQKLKATTQTYAKEFSVAAAVSAVVLSVSLVSLNENSGDANNGMSGNSMTWQSALSVQPSGTSLTLADESVITPQVSFMNHSDELCRQYELKRRMSASTAIACFQPVNNEENYQWQVLYETSLESVNTSNEYQTASSPPQLDKAIDELIDGVFLNREEEQSRLKMIAKNTQ